MPFAKRKGYRVERKIRFFFHKNGWNVVRAGASLGDADLICLRDGKCLLLQIKSTKKKILYYDGYMKSYLSGFPFYLAVDFGYGKIRVLKPQKKVKPADGQDINDFVKNLSKERL